VLQARGDPTSRLDVVVMSKPGGGARR
jgi:hypothetical protein